MVGQVFDLVGGFLLNPAGIIPRYFDNVRLAAYVKSFFFMVMLSAIQGVSAFYMIFYPEPLYYGLGASTPHAHLYVIEQSNPLLLAGLIIVFAIINILYFHVILGCLNFGLCKLLHQGGGSMPRFLHVMSCNGFSFMPILLTIPIATFRFFFFGRIAFNNHEFPFFDLTPVNSVYIVLLVICYVWMFVIQAKVNRVLFRGLGWRASIPAVITGLVTILLLAIIAIVLPSVLNTLVYTIIDE
nr:hypothetical protein [Candidatus Sigynarchaeota archaeon]